MVKRLQLHPVVFRFTVERGQKEYSILTKNNCYFPVYHFSITLECQNKGIEKLLTQFYEFSMIDHIRNFTLIKEPIARINNRLIGLPRGYDVAHSNTLLKLYTPRKMHYSFNVFFNFYASMQDIRESARISPEDFVIERIG